MLVRVERIWPKVGEVRVGSGLPQFGWFGKLKASNRNWTVCFSANRKSLWAEKSHAMTPGVTIVFRPALRAEIVAALGEQQVGVMNSDRASVVDRARPRITKEVGQTLRKPALQFHAQRVVVRLAAAIDLLEPAKLRIGSPRGYRPGCRWDRVVEGSEDLEFTAHRADVAHLQGRVSSKLALYVKHVLDGIGRPAIVDVGEAVRIDNQGRRLSQASVWSVPVQIQLSRRRFVAAAAPPVAGHVEAWVAGILGVEHAGASADNPFGIGVPGDAEARRKIIWVRLF